MDDDRLYGGDPCPRCGAELDYDQQETTDSEGFPDWRLFITHPVPQCGWRPDGYPSTREGWGEPPA